MTSEFRMCFEDTGGDVDIRGVERVRILEVMVTSEFRMCCEDTGGDDVRGVGCFKDTEGDGDVRSL